MKKILSLLLALVLLVAIGASPVQAAKPAGNLAGAQKVAWNLSAAVMPVPPYGLRDIPGSDTASKLIVNQPNGNTEVTITGAMNGLNPNTTYTVYLAKGYEPYVYTGWNVEGTWVLRLHYGASTYDHDVVIEVQSNGTFSGIGGYPTTGSPYNYPYNETVTGTIDVMTGAITLHSDYESTYFYDAVGTIAPDGTMSGTWNGKNQPTYTWESISGHAVKTHTGNIWYPGLFTSTVPPFTFVTDAYGAGSWHVNLTDANLPAGGLEYNLSVWINGGGGTMLISDTFKVTKS